MKCPNTVRSTVLTLAALAAALPAVAADWPQWLGPNRDGTTSETVTPFEGEPKTAWKKEIGIGYSALTIYDGKAYTMGNVDDNDVVYCFDAATGNEIWKKTYPAKQNFGGYYGPRCTPAVDATGVYTLSMEGLVQCWDPKTGDLKWTQDVTKLGTKAPQWGFSGSGLLQDDVVVFEVGPVIAFKKDGGAVAWRSQPRKPGYSSPVALQFGGKPAIASFDAQGFVIVEPGTGRQLAEYPWKTAYDVNAAVPLVKDGQVFITSGYKTGGALLELTATGLRQLWKGKELGSQCNNPVVVGDYLYGFDGNVGGRGTLKCIDWKSGQTKWEKDGLGAGSLIVAGGKLVILGEKGQLVIAEPNPQAFKPLAEAKILDGDYCWTPPTLANGRIYARNYIKRTKISEIICIDVSK